MMDVDQLRNRTSFGSRAKITRRYNSYRRLEISSRLHCNLDNFRDRMSAVCSKDRGENENGKLCTDSSEFGSIQTI